MLVTKSLGFVSRWCRVNAFCLARLPHRQTAVEDNTKWQRRRGRKVGATLGGYPARPASQRPATAGGASFGETRLRQELADDAAFYIRQAEVAAGVAIRELLVVEA